MIKVHQSLLKSKCLVKLFKNFMNNLDAKAIIEL